jgi:hypothetical protein
MPPATFFSEHKAVKKVAKNRFCISDIKTTTDNF